MFDTHLDSTLPKPALYAQLNQALHALIEDESDWIANLANASALLFHSLPGLNWAGFYLLKDDTLIVGPFQGRPACVRIPLGRGVCGRAAVERQSIIVPNVHEFAGHIACDSASNAEIVVPMIQAERLVGVLDLDSPTFERFDDEDREGLEAFVAVLLRQSERRTADSGR
jgi:L-methionine (R)-S-oxide reductase